MIRSISAHLVACAITLCVLWMPASATGALLEGHNVEFQWLFPTINTPYADADNGSKLVGPDCEVNGVAGTSGSIDISDTNILIDFNAYGTLTSEAFNGFRITDINGTIPGFTGVTINPATTLSGVNNIHVAFDSDNVWVDLAGLYFTDDTIVSLDISAVPEPTSLSLLALGGLALLRRRRA